MNKLLKLIGLAVVGVLAHMTSAFASCALVAAPATISSPGYYCLSASATISSGNGITITAAGVFLDLNGYTLTGPGGSTTGAGVMFDPGAFASKVYNGRIKGFMYGVRANGNTDIYVHGVNASDNSFRGIKLEGARAHVEHSRADNISGYPGYADSFTMGIEVIGPDCVIQGNHVRNNTPLGVGEGIGISVSSGGTGCEVYDNLVRVGATAVPYGRTFGIWIGYSTGAVIRDNVVIGTMYGVLGDPTVDFSQNYTDTKCGQWMTVQTDTACLDTFSYIEGKTIAEPTDGNWWYRLGVVYHEQFQDEIQALAKWDYACSLGQAEACRVAARTRAQ